MNTVNINNTIITTDFDSIDFTGLLIGQQIFVLEEKEEDKTKQIYNDLIAYCLCEKPFDNLYSFNSTQSNFNIYSYDDERMEMENDIKNNSVNYLRIDDVLIKVAHYDYEDIEYWNDKKENILKLNDSNFIEQTTSFKKKVSYYDNGIAKETEIYKIKYCSTFNLDICSLAIKINYEFNPVKCSFYKRMELYLFDEQINKYIHVTLDNNSGIRELIKSLTNKFNIEDIQNCINHLSIYGCEINKLRYSENIQQIMFKTFDNIDFGNHTIETIMNAFILPFYEDKEINSKAYIKDFYSYFSHDVNCACPYELEYSDDKQIRQKIKDFKCKARSILDYKTGESHIDIYTGKILVKNYNEIYRDAELLNVKMNNQNLYYKKIDNIFARIYDPYELYTIKKTIEERIKICKLLSS